MQNPGAKVVFRQLVRKETGCCTYLLGDAEFGEYVLVDPLMDYERLLPQVTARGGREASIKYVIDTHIHADHLSGAREVCSLTGAELMMHESTPISADFHRLRDGMVMELCGLKTEVLHTPGHSPEHISLLIDNRLLLSGDCLLVRDVGRTDLGRGNNHALYRSLFERILSLDDRLEVYPGHVGAQHFLAGELSSTIGIERRSNPALQVKSLDEFVSYMTEGWPPKPLNYELYLKVNQQLITLEEAQGLIRVSSGEA